MVRGWAGGKLWGGEGNEPEQVVHQAALSDAGDPEGKDDVCCPLDLTLGTDGCCEWESGVPAQGADHDEWEVANIACKRMGLAQVGQVQEQQSC